MDEKEAVVLSQGHHSLDVEDGQAEMEEREEDEDGG